jgi:hypothetical protein
MMMDHPSHDPPKLQIKHMEHTRRGGRVAFTEKLQESIVCTMFITILWLTI